MKARYNFEELFGKIPKKIPVNSNIELNGKKSSFSIFVVVIILVTGIAVYDRYKRKKEILYT